MRRLVQLLKVRLQDPEISIEDLGVTSQLLLQLDGDEESILKDYLARRRPLLLDVLNSFPISIAPAVERVGLIGVRR